MRAAQETLANFGRDSNRKAVARLRLQCGLEHLAAADLAHAGMAVLRHNLESRENCNFFNGEFVVDGGGDVHYLTNGADQSKQAITDLFTRLLVHDLKVAVAVHVSPADAAEQSLKSQGGVGCRIKGEPLMR